MRNTFSIVFALLLPLFIWACSSENKKPLKDASTTTGNTVSDSARDSRVIDSIKPGIKKTLDSAIKTTPAPDSQKNYRRRHPATTYVPI